MCWETHCGTSGGSPEGIFEEGIHDDPDEFPQDLRCLQHPVSRDAGAAGRAYRRRLLQIPSSVHEFLLVPREREQDREELKKMIAEVNRTELPPEEVLSDHLYLYCSREREVRIV